MVVAKFQSLQGSWGIRQRFIWVQCRVASRAAIISEGPDTELEQGCAVQTGQFEGAQRPFEEAFNCWRAALAQCGKLVTCRRSKVIWN